jgi:phage terminase large subunit
MSLSACRPSAPTSLEATALPPRPEYRPYFPRGAARQLWACQAPEVLIAGPAGTGKRRACLEVLHWNATEYPGYRGLICRKTRESITESVLVTFEEKVVEVGHSATAEGG